LGDLRSVSLHIRGWPEEGGGDELADQRIVI
jgi:hypothetical protein